jgi:hypothetical protein
MALKMTSVLVSSRRRIEARLQDLVKITVKFIRKGVHVQQTEGGLSVD